MMPKLRSAGSILRCCNNCCRAARMKVSRPIAFGQERQEKRIQMSDTENFTATSALPAAREAANETLRAPRLVEAEANAFKGGTSEEQVQAATDELRRRRREQGIDPFAQGELVERHLSPEVRRSLETDTSATGLRRATRDVSDQKLVEKYEPWIGKDLAQPDEIARWEKSAREQGYEIPRPSQGRAAEKIGLMLDDGTAINGLRDNQPVGFDGRHEINLREAADLTKNYRTALDAHRAEMLRQLGEQESAQVQPEVRAEPEPAPTPPPQPAVDPLLAEKQRLQAWANYAQ